MIVVLDTGVLTMVSHPKATGENEQCQRWLDGLLRRGAQAVIPEIADYELRRELLRADKTESIQRLDQLAAALAYQPITTEIMRLAAMLWAQIRRQHRPTARKEALDVDVILAAQAMNIQDATRDEVIIATTNVKHLAQFTKASTWNQIKA